jgi:hypothetical protein
MQALQRELRRRTLTAAVTARILHRAESGWNRSVGSRESGTGGRFLLAAVKYSQGGGSARDAASCAHCRPVAVLPDFAFPIDMSGGFFAHAINNERSAKPNLAAHYFVAQNLDRSKAMRATPRPKSSDAQSPQNSEDRWLRHRDRCADRQHGILRSGLTLLRLPATAR